MAWWDIGGDDLVIGDPVVDRLARQLRGIVEDRSEQGRERPTLGALLSAIADGLRRKTAMWCGPEEDCLFGVLVARVDLPDGHIELMQQDEATDPELAKRVAEAFEDIALMYEDVRERKPKRAELLAVVGFLLSARPDMHVELPEGAAVLDVTALPSEPVAPVRATTSEHD
jgi:hypothetical protein